MTFFSFAFLYRCMFISFDNNFNCDQGIDKIDQISHYGSIDIQHTGINQWWRKKEKQNHDFSPIVSYVSSMRSIKCVANSEQS